MIVFLGFLAVILVLGVAAGLGLSFFGVFFALFVETKLFDKTVDFVSSLFGYLVTAFVWPFVFLIELFSKPQKKVGYPNRAA